MLKFITSVFRLRLPAVKKLTVDYCESPNADLLEFLKNSSPTSTKFLSFGYNCDAPNTPINYYVDGLEVALKGVTQEIHMSRWSHSKESLQKLIKAGAGAERFILYWSQINFDSDLDFSGPEYKIKYFGIPYCGDYVGECWSSKPEKMERIIKAFGNCGIKDSLKTFNRYKKEHSCGITVENVKQMLSDNGMSLVNVVQENSVPSS